jgi:hypothetical protein
MLALGPSAHPKNARDLTNTKPLLAIYLKECKSGYNKDISTPMCALFITANLWKQPGCTTTDEWIKKM